MTLEWKDCCWLAAKEKVKSTFCNNVFLIKYSDVFVTLNEFKITGLTDYWVNSGSHQLACLVSSITKSLFYSAFHTQSFLRPEISSVVIKNHLKMGVIR